MKDFIYGPQIVSRFNHTFEDDNWSLTEHRHIPLPRFMINSGGTRSFVRLESDKGLTVEAMAVSGVIVQAALFKEWKSGGIVVSPDRGMNDAQVIFNEFNKEKWKSH